MNKKLVGVAVAAALGLTAFSATAEDMYRGAWYAVPGVSYMNTDSDLDADNGAGGFISIGKELSQHWDLQGRLGHNEADEDLNVAGASGNYKQTTFGLDALYMFSRSNFRPFLLAGLGVADNDADYKVGGVRIDEDKTSWLAGVGLGAQILFNDRFGIQADLRHQWSKAKVNTSGIAGDSNTETVGNTLLNLGGIIRFGATAPVVAAAPEPTPAPAAAPAPAPAPKCEPKIDTITVGAEKLFGFDKSNLTAEGKSALDDAAAKIKANSKITNVIVTGHTDRLGSYAYNQKLSERRAKQVATYLATKGVSSSIITATGRGESVPVAACKGVKPRKALISCLQPNRRVTIEAQVKQESGCK
ncbi:MAG: OmpA family protein [Methylophilaceae bacterium]